MVSCFVRGRRVSLRPEVADRVQCKRDGQAGAGFSSWALRRASLPIHREVGQSETLARGSLPTLIGGYRADQCHPMRRLTGLEQFGVNVALIDQVLSREQVSVRCTL
jgi:hypothetical protein